MDHLTLGKSTTTHNNNNEDLYSVLSPTTAGAHELTKTEKIQSKQQSTQNQKTHSYTKTSLEHYTYEPVPKRGLTTLPIV